MPDITLAQSKELRRNIILSCIINDYSDNMYCSIVFNDEISGAVLYSNDSIHITEEPYNDLKELHTIISRLLNEVLTTGIMNIPHEED